MYSDKLDLLSYLHTELVHVVSQSYLTKSQGKYECKKKRDVSG